VQIGYTMMCEQRSPKDLVDDVVLAEQAGFPFSVISDHYHPWLESQGHGGYAWSVLGAAARTEHIGLMTYVTCPIIRYHPAVVAQKAATMAQLSDGRFRLGLGSGESLNEHVIGQGWPPVNTRHAMLREAIEIIRKLHAGGYVSYRGEHYDVDSARIFDLPDKPVEIGLAVSGQQSCRMAGELADLVICTEPKAELIEMFGAAGGAGKPAVGQLGVATAPTRARRWRSPTTSSAGSAWAGRSTPSCRARSTSPPPPPTSGRRTWRARSRTAPTSTPTSSRSRASRTPGSPSWRSCRSAPTRKPSASGMRPNCARPSSAWASER